MTEMFTVLEVRPLVNMFVRCLESRPREARRCPESRPLGAAIPP